MSTYDEWERKPKMSEAIQMGIYARQNAKLSVLEQGMKTEYSKLDSKFDSRNEKLETKIDKLNDKIDAQGESLRADIKALDVKIDKQGERLEAKIDAVQSQNDSRMKWVIGLLMLVVASTLPVLLSFMLPLIGAFFQQT